MTKIANKAKCNIIEAGDTNSGSFWGDLLVCPTYEEIINTDKFNVSGTYENNQLVKESDITKYTGKTKNYSYIWGEWDLTEKPGQSLNNFTYLNLRIRQNFLNAPDTNLKITISLRLSYRDSYSSPYTSVTKNLTVNFTQTTGSDKKYAYSQDFEVTFGNSSSPQFGSITITSVTIETVDGTSIYEYVTNIKDVTQNYFINALSVASTSFYIDSYDDNTTNKIISSKCRITPNFTIPTGTGINNIEIFIDNKDYNYTLGQSVGTTYNTLYNNIDYEFTAIDHYDERGYKLPYFYTKFAIKDKNDNYVSYVHALWDPTTTQTGIELTSLIL